MKKIIATVAIALSLTGCVRHYSTRVLINGHQYICVIKQDENRKHEYSIQGCDQVVPATVEQP